MVVCCGAQRNRGDWRLRNDARVWSFPWSLTVPPLSLAPLELVTPPELPAVDLPELTDAGGPETFDPLKRTHEIGTRGSSRQVGRAELLDGLIQQERFGDPMRDFQLICTACSMFWREHMRRLVSDTRWTSAYARAAARVGGSGKRVCVLGIGSTVAALAAARAGASVLWVERVQRFASVMQACASRNGLAARVNVTVVGGWHELATLAKQPQHARKFDAVITEEVGDELLGADLLPLSQVARQVLLRPGGLFLPSRLRVHAALASIRTTVVSGFDLRAFNAFRSNE